MKFGRLTDPQMTMHGQTTRQCIILLCGPLVIAAGEWPKFESTVVMLRRFKNETVLLAMHFTVPRAWSAGFVPGIDWHNGTQSLQLDFSLWLFQVTMTLNK